MNIILNILGAIGDMVLLSIFFQNMLRERKTSVPLPLYWLGFVCMELLLIANMYVTAGYHTITRTLFMIIGSTLLTFALSFFYTTSMRSRIFATLLFQIFAAIGENMTGILLTTMDPSLLNGDGFSLDTKVTFGSKIIIFLLICISIAVFNRRDKKHTAYYNILLLLTPVVTYCFIWIFPTEIMSDPRKNLICLLLLAAIMFLNFINFFLFNTILDNYDLQEQLRSYKEQVSYQSEKYSQISSAYKSTRSIVHDTKKHVMFMRACAENRECDKIITCSNKLIDDLDNTYIKVNTGNLVIDTFMGNAYNLAEEYKIRLTTDIHVLADDIPLQDYDLCVILGNLLDNSLQACRKITEADDRYISVQIMTKEKHFVIHVVNPLVPEEEYNSTADILFHGYGIANVEQLTDKNGGTYFCNTDDGNYDTYVIIPIMRNSDGFRIGANIGLESYDETGIIQIPHN